MRISVLLLFLALLPSAHGADLNEATQLYGRGEFGKAANLLMQLRGASPAEADIRLWLGRSYLKIRQWDNAVREIEKAVQLQPSNARYHLWLGRAYGARASHTFFAMALRWARRVGKEFETARSLDPKDLDVRFDLLEFYLNAPGIVGGGKDKAEAEGRAISQIDPAKGYTARAIIYQKNKNWDLAKKELIQATVEFPKYADAYGDLADYLLDRKDFEGALSNAKKALMLNSDSKHARFLVAASQIQLRTNLDQAADDLRELSTGTLSEEEDPPFEEVYYWLGQCYLAKGDKVKAREAFEVALAINADYADAKEGISGLK